MGNFGPWLYHYNVQHNVRSMLHVHSLPCWFHYPSFFLVLQIFRFLFLDACIHLWLGEDMFELLMCENLWPTTNFNSSFSIYLLQTSLYIKTPIVALQHWTNYNHFQTWKTKHWLHLLWLMLVKLYLVIIQHDFWLVWLWSHPNGT